MSGYHPRSEDGDDDNVLKKRRMSEQRVNPHAPPPSRVVHARAVPDGSLSTDMQTSLLSYGNISHIMLMPKLRQALIEFETIEAAIKCVDASKENGVMIRDRPVYFNFSKSQEINRGQSDGNLKPNKILLFTVQNALYPITCDVLQAICQPIGTVMRIVMVRKRGVQALVEFDSVESAVKAKQSLNFADIYAGCCTLKIEFSRTDALNVTYNSDDTRDYSNPGLPTREARHQNMHPGQQGAPHLMGGAWGGNSYDPRGGQGQQGQGAAMDPWQQSPQHMGYGGAGRGAYGGAQPVGAPMGGMGMQNNQGGFQVPGSVIMFYELSTKYFNCMRLFNLVCLYANPIKIKFIVNKPGMAMVQVDDPYQAQVVAETLQGLEVFGQRIECGPSKHAFIADSRNQARLPDGSPHTLDCARSMNHRFNTARAGSQSKGPQSRPTAVLHFFNAPKDTPHSALIDLFKSHGAVVPQAILTLRPRDGSAAKSDRGFVQFTSESEAVDALVLCNHVEIQNPKGQIFTVKFAFSKSHIDDNDASATRPALGQEGQQVVQQVADGTEAVAVTADDSEQVQFSSEAQ
eukprot:m.256307 g.256307  ORF g.256307 m.256307 type:complete len:573 (-) comp34250_c0_seq1:243-1961(-)